MTATMTQNVNQESVSAFKRPIAALDAGNRTTQWIDPKGNIRTIPSFVKVLETWEVKPMFPSLTQPEPLLETTPTTAAMPETDFRFDEPLAGL